MRRLACLAVLLLAGCVTAQDTITGVDPGPRRRFLNFAGWDSPVYLVSVNAPFQLPPEAVAERLARHADGAVSGTTVTYTAKPGAAKLPHYRIVALFDALQGFSTKEACEAAYRPAVAARYVDRTNLFLAFCDEDEPIAGAKVSGPKLAGLDDPALADMMSQGMRAMFPSAAGGIDDRGGSMGSIRVSPTPGFRLNPFEGIL